MQYARPSIAEGILFTDEYQLTMAQLYYRAGLHEKHAQFDYYFRSYPDYGRHQAGYCVSAGLEWLIQWMQEAHFRDEDIVLLRGQVTRTGDPLFSDDFLAWLQLNGAFGEISLKAIPEGRVVHPIVPVMMIEGPLVSAQLLETALLNYMNYQTLIATKAARIVDSTRGRPVLEFGVRRAQGKAALAGARAAMIGGAEFTSNVGISHALGLAPKGTHGHSMVQTFMALGLGELGSFQAYAEVYPDDCTLLVDTIDTLGSGIPNAITVFEELRKKGHEPVGIRLDSGDFAYLSIQATKMLDEAGFPDTSIVLSNQLDELVIWQIITQITEEAPRYSVDADHVINRLVYGVGTRLITSEGASALDGVYKLVALQDSDQWIPAIKVSESPEKTPTPGRKNAWRIYDQRGQSTADLISLESEDPRSLGEIVLHHPTEFSKVRTLTASECQEIELLHVDVLQEGRLVAELPPLDDLRARREQDLERLDPGVKRLVNPHVYHVSLTEKLWNLKQDLITSAMDKSR